MQKEKLNAWKYFQRIGLIVAIIASVGTLIGVYYQIETKESKLELQLLSVDYLTSNSNIDNLSSNYKYKGTPVKNLWLVKFKLINNGDLTIVGKGKKQNIIGDKISFKYNSNIQLLDNIEVIQKELPITLVKEDSISISVYFEQWRKNESATFSIYLKADTLINNFLPTVVNRPLLEGDVSINDFTIISNNQKIPVIDYLSDPLPLIIRVISISIILALLIMLTGLFGSFIIGWFQNLHWKRNHYDNFKKFIKFEYKKNNNKSFLQFSSGMERFDDEEEKILKQPWKLANEHWKKFEGKEIPVIYPEIETWKGFIGFLFLIFIEISVFSLIILSIVKK